MKNNIKLAKSAGFCFGVDRAVKIAEDNCSDVIYSLGDIIHNKNAISDLKAKGIIARDNINDIPDGSKVIIRAHGEPLATYDSLKAKNCIITDATCPFVSKIHRIVEKAADVIILGKASHPEIIGISGHCKKYAIWETLEDVISGISSLQGCNHSITFVSQTTLDTEKYKKFKDIIKKGYTNAQIFDTICSATDERQNEARRLAGESDFMIVIGDSKSSNSQRLYEIASSICPKVLNIQDASELVDVNLQGVINLSITAGASTPDRVIKEVFNIMATTFESNQDFEAMLNASFKTLNVGDKVTALIVSVRDNELQVDLGVKQSGVIPISEITDDPSYKLKEQIKVGDEMDAIVTRINDVEGIITLSKKRIAQTKGWEVAAKACDDGEVVEGLVVEENRGGIVAVYSSVRVFIPASQTGLSRETPMSELMKKTIKFKITEVNRAKKRVVGSARSVMMEERKILADKAWETLAVGNKYTGIVKSITAYGAFVDIGGVDGMVHISELSWGRIKHPSDVLTAGQSLEVYILSLDPEKRKISLGHKKADENPWSKFLEVSKEGDIVDIKILKFMAFGAFAEIMPGVDGLVHISQICEKRISKAEEELKIGEIVKAKIIEIDAEKRKISLSIREADPNFVPKEARVEASAE